MKLLVDICTGDSGELPIEGVIEGLKELLDNGNWGLKSWAEAKQSDNYKYAHIMKSWSGENIFAKSKQGMCAYGTIGQAEKYNKPHFRDSRSVEIFYVEVGL